VKNGGNSLNVHSLLLPTDLPTTNLPTNLAPQH
jgi:hypothetical protein